MESESESWSYKRHSSVVDEKWVRRPLSDTGGCLGGLDRHHGIHGHIWSQPVGTAQDQQGSRQMLEESIATTAPRHGNMNSL